MPANFRATEHHLVVCIEMRQIVDSTNRIEIRLGSELGLFEHCHGYIGKQTKISDLTNDKRKGCTLSGRNEPKIPVTAHVEFSYYLLASGRYLRQVDLHEDGSKQVTGLAKRTRFWFPQIKYSERRR